MFNSLILAAVVALSIPPDPTVLPEVVHANIISPTHVALYHHEGVTLAEVADVRVDLLGRHVLRSGSSFAQSSFVPGKYETEWQSKMPVNRNGKTVVVTHRVVTDCADFKTRSACAKAHLQSVRDLIGLTSIMTLGAK